MRLGLKIVLLGHAILGLGVGAGLLVSQLVSLPSIEKVEQEHLFLSMRGLAKPLQSDIERLAGVARDWAVWAPTKRFIEGREPAYAADNLNADSFLSTRFAYMAFLRNDGSLVWAGEYDERNHAIRRVPELDWVLRALGDPALAETTSRLGPLWRDGQWYGMAAWRVADPAQPGASPGWFVGLHRWDAAFWAELVELAGLSFQVGREDFTLAEPLAIESRVVSGPQGDQTAWTLRLPSIEPGTALSLAGRSPRPLAEAAIAAHRLLAILFVGLLGTMIWTFLGFIHLTVVRPVLELQGLFLKLKQTNDLSLRVAPRQSDEIGALGHGVNALIGRLEEYTATLEGMANTDALTQLPNRRSLDQGLDLVWRICRREKRPMGIILVDIDHFKKYNDHYGHQAGDMCLRAVADLIKSAAHRPSDFAARYGGEEFLVLLPNCELSGTLVVARRLRDAVQQTKMAHQASPLGQVTISLGCAACVPESNDGPAALVAEADARLYAAKAAGRNRVEPAEAG